MLGARQSGVPMLRFADLSVDVDLLDAARDTAERLLKTQPPVAARHLERWLSGGQHYLRA
jgi:ATP-dependent DNA helicase RecG